MSQQAKKQIAEKVWLHYFNQELFQRGVITEPERNKMALKIERRKPSASVTPPRRSRDLSR